MNGALPPSSMLTFFTVPAVCARRILPTSVEPVNESLRTSGLVLSSPPIGPDLEPTMTFSTPFGIPARSASTARAVAESGVALAGLITTVQPAARAGETLRVIIEEGKFHGVIAATTPIGCLIAR